MNRRSCGKNFQTMRMVFLTAMTLAAIFFVTAKDAHAQCGFNSIGDYTCANGTGGGTGGPGGGGTGNPVTDIFLDDFLPNITGGGSCSALSMLPAILAAMPREIQTALSAQLMAFLSFTSDCSSITDLITNLLFLQGVFDNLPDDVCGVGDITGNDLTNDAAIALLFNRLAQDLTWSNNILSMDIAALSTDICTGSGPGTVPGTIPFDPTGPDSDPGEPGGPVGPGETGDPPGGDPLGAWCGAAGAASNATDPNIPGTYNLSETDPARRIAESARLSIDASTADHNGATSTSGTRGGLGCALAVTRMLRCAGHDIRETVSTIVLYDMLDDDPCYTIVDTGYVDAGVLQPGDILVTRSQGTGRTCTYGHTGIYVGNGRIISNSSSGFQGSAPGTVQDNYSVDTWNQPNCRGVVYKNPDQSAVFRRTCA